MSRKDLLFRFLGDTKSLEKAAQRAERSMDGMGRKAGGSSMMMGGLTKAAAAAGSMFAVGQFAQGINNAIGLASDYDESINAVRVSTGSAADEILRIGEDSARSFGLSKTEVNEAATAFAAFGEKIDDSNVAGVFNDYLTRATDFASVMNLEVGDALTKFRSGLAGESEPLRAFGIDLSAAAVEAYALSKGIATSKGSMTEAEKVQARYGLLMEQTAKVQGDFANTSDGLANQQRILNAEWENAQVAIGENLVPAMTELVSLMANAASAVPSMIDNFQLGLNTLERTTGRIQDAIFGGDSWSDYDEAMYEVMATTQQATERIKDGYAATQVAAEWMAHLADKGLLTAESMLKVQETTGLSNDGMVDATNLAEKHADVLGYTSEQLELLNDLTGEYADDKARRAVAAEEDLAESARDLAYQTMQAADASEDLADEMVRVHDAANILVDPVRKAERTFRDYEKALEDANADGEITAGEALDITEKFHDMQSAIDDVNPGNIKAFRKQLVEDMGLSVEAADAIIARLGFLDQIEVNPSMASLNDLAGRIERATQYPIRFDFTNLRFATQAEIEREMTRALQTLARRGVYVPI